MTIHGAHDQQERSDMDAARIRDNNRRAGVINEQAYTRRLIERLFESNRAYRKAFVIDNDERTIQRMELDGIKEYLITLLEGEHTLQRAIAVRADNWASEAREVQKEMSRP